MSKEKAKEKRKKVVKKPSGLLRLRKHTLERVMIDYDKISKPLEHLRRKHMKRERDGE